MRIRPTNKARTGPTRISTRAVVSVSDTRSTDSQDGMQRARQAGSFNARQTAAGGAEMCLLPLSSMVS